MIRSISGEKTLERSLVSIVAHELSLARQVASPNQDTRPDDEISLIVIHGISLPAGHFGGRHVQELFCNQLDMAEHPDLNSLTDVRVSSHLFIRRDGETIQFVPFDRRAWHAGESNYEGRANCNDFSIGIELEGIDTSAYTEAQYTALAKSCCELIQHYDIDPAAITGHSQIAPDRKTDPGEAFDWQRFTNSLANGLG